MGSIIVLGVFGTFSVLVGILIGAYANRPSTLSRAERCELTALRRLGADPKDLAWDNRELDPRLSTIVDEIRKHERRQLDT